VTKRDLKQLKQFYAENSLETFHDKNEEICLIAIYLQPYCI